MVELTADVGYENVTVRGLARLAGVSTATFYKHFPNVEECFGSTYESLTRCALRRAYTAQRETQGGEEGVRAALRTLMGDAAAHPKEARLVLVESYAVGTAMSARMSRGTAALERILSDGFPVDAGAIPVRSHLARGIAAGVTHIVRTRLLSDLSDELPDQADEVGDWAASLSETEVVGLEPHFLCGAAIAESFRGPGDATRLCAIFGDADGERSRILTAVTKLSLTHGFSQLTLSRIRAQSGVSRRAFHSHFDDVDGCYLTALEMIAASAIAHSSGLMDVFAVEAARNPDLARLVLVEIRAPGRSGICRRERLISVAASQLATARRETATLYAEASIAYAWRLAEVALEAGRADELARLTPLLAHAFAAPNPSELRAMHLALS